jgi:TM2 domain-containing membrane protein YozV
MNCANHPEVTATAFCRECGKPMCPECQQPALGSVYCAEHLPVQAAPPPPPRVETPAFTGSPYSSSASSSASPYSSSASPYTAPLPATHVVDPGAHPLLALLLGFIPGVGAIYNGQYAKGLIHAVVFGILVSTETTNISDGLHALVGIMIAAWVFYQAFEAFHTARKRRYGQAVEEFSSIFDIRPAHGRFPVGAILLIGLGFILLLDTTDIISFAVLTRYWPALLIVFGLYLLYNRLGPSDHHAAIAPPSGNTTSDGGTRR